MSKKVRVTEALRKEIRRRIAELTPHYQWYTIPRDERESVECAYIRIDKVHDVAETFSDDTVTAMIYEKARIQELMAVRTVEWLDANKLWCYATLHPEPEEDETK